MTKKKKKNKVYLTTFFQFKWLLFFLHLLCSFFLVFVKNYEGESNQCQANRFVKWKCSLMECVYPNTILYFFPLKIGRLTKQSWPCRRLDVAMSIYVLWFCFLYPTENKWRCWISMTLIGYHQRWCRQTNVFLIRSEKCVDVENVENASFFKGRS